MINRRTFLRSSLAGVAMLQTLQAFPNSKVLSKWLEVRGKRLENTSGTEASIPNNPLTSNHSPLTTKSGEESLPIEGEVWRGSVSDTLRISVESEQALEVNPEGKRYWTNADMMHGERINGVELSSSGKYVRIHKNITYKGGETEGRDIFTLTARLRALGATRPLTPRRARRHSSANTRARVTPG